MTGPFRVLVLLGLVFVASWMGCVVYLFTLDDPQEYLLREIREQDRWLGHFTAADGPHIVVTGGSSCTFSIDGGMATTRFHVPVINAGLGAGLGSYGVLVMASRLSRPGDTFVLSLEPSLLGSSDGYTQDALQLLILHGQWDRLSQAMPITGRAVPLDQLLFSARPGLDNFAAWVGRVATHTTFRYANSQIRPGGLMVTNLRYALTGEGYQPSLSTENRRLLIHFRDWAARRQIKVVYSMPWYFVDQDNAAGQQVKNAKFLAVLAAIVPVVHEAELGVQTNPSFFADNKWHLTEQAAQVRTAELIQHLLAHDYWTPAQLAAAAKTGASGQN